MVMRLAKVSSLIILGVFYWVSVASAAYDKDPIKTTQTQTVQVTEELLKREGEPGPASPTIRLSDTSKFLTQKPYEKIAEEADKDQLKEESSPWWKNWFSWDKDEEESDQGDAVSKPID